MRKVQRWRYYCDFCPKAGQSGFHMKNHESSCTLNPGRVCKMCAKMGHDGTPAIETLLAVLPSMPDDMNWDREEAFKLVVEAAMPALRELTQNCPVCIMAALRQKKIRVPIVQSFNFKAEMEEIFKGINEEEAEREYHY